MQGCQRNVEDWQKILQVRSLVLTQKVHSQFELCILKNASYEHFLQEEITSWVKFASICRKSGKMALSERTLLSLLGNDPACNQSQPMSEKYPQVTFAYMKHLWQVGQKTEAFSLLSQFVLTHQRPLLTTAEDEDNTKLLSRYVAVCVMGGSMWTVYEVEIEGVHSIQARDRGRRRVCSQCMR